MCGANYVKLKMGIWLPLCCQMILLAPVACMPEEFACLDDGTCIPKSLVCDGRPYCRDGSDENNCSSPCESLLFSQSIVSSSSFTFVA